MLIPCARRILSRLVSRRSATIHRGCCSTPTRARPPCSLTATPIRPSSLVEEIENCSAGFYAPLFQWFPPKRRGRVGWVMEIKKRRPGREDARAGRCGGVDTLEGAT